MWILNKDMRYLERCLYVFRVQWVLWAQVHGIWVSRVEQILLERNLSLTLEATSLRSGIDIVCTRLPLMIRRISIESGVKAITYGKAQTEIDNKIHLEKQPK